MILEAGDLARSLLPELTHGSHLSVAAVQTTRPKYLIFGSDTTRPLCVLQVGVERELSAVHHLLQLLEPCLPGRVPAALAFAPWRRGLHVQVQSGLAGDPWFVLQQSLQSADDWLALGRQALVTLHDLHAAVARFPEFTHQIRPADELAAQIQLTQHRQVELPPAAADRVRAAVEQLRPLGTMKAIAQHGDYSLNNILASLPDGPIRVIDFDEFGLSAMPLLDEFGLALSLWVLGESSHGPSLRDAVGVCLEQACQRHPALAPYSDALFVYYLLWRINRCFEEPRRAAFQRVLVKILIEVKVGPN